MKSIYCKTALLTRPLNDSLDTKARLDKLSIEAKDLIENILILDVNKRYSLKDIWYHKWFTG